MRRLLLLRHAKAARDASDGDKNRALDRRGRAAAVQMGAWMRDEKLLPALALISDARRTRETFELVAAQFSAPVPSRIEAALYQASEQTLLRILRAMAGNAPILLLIGHNPGLADFALRLVGEGDAEAFARIQTKFPTAALCSLAFDLASWSKADWGGGRLERFVTPASLSGAPDKD